MCPFPYHNYTRTMKNLSLENLIKTLIKDELDKALALSNTRRKEFKKQFKLSEAQTANLAADPNIDPNNPLNTMDANNTATAGVPGGGSDPGAPSPTPGAGIPPTADPTKPDTQNGNPDTKNDPAMDAAPKNPLDDITSTAKDLTKQTRDVPTILKAVKAKIQSNYKELGDPKQVVQALRDTKDATLISVAQRLEQFLKVGR
jgi:hypothetical protein